MSNYEFPDSLSQGGKLRPIVTGGDTDSIFIIFPGCDTPALAMEWAKKAADWINAKFFTKPMAVRLILFFTGGNSSLFADRV